jgi:predicted RNase H-like nuclease (RuvC/YqgF family)
MEEADEMVEEKPLPKYENIEKLMQEIEKSTDEEAHKFKVQEMKRVADMLEKKCTGLEEGDNAEHIDQKKLKQMKKDIMSLRKGIEKMEKLGEKKFTKKETKTEMKEGFDLRKFLVENKLTTSSRMLNENVNIEQAFTQAGINLETPVTVAINDDLGTIVEYKEFNTGREALEYVKQEMQSEYLAGELPEIHYEGDIEPSSELETQPKLEFQFEDADILIIQA